MITQTPTLSWTTIPQLLSRETCAQIIERTEAIGFEPATVRTLKGPVMKPHVRNNERVLFTDEDLQRTLFDRLCKFIPVNLQGGRPVGLYDGFKVYKYGPGQRFNPHQDGYLEQNGVRTRLTCLVYLNEEMDGGQTTFFADDKVGDVRPVVHLLQPATGLGVAFEHRWWHEGQEVTQGFKYVLRTDVLYGQEGNLP